MVLSKAREEGQPAPSAQVHVLQVQPERKLPGLSPGPSQARDGAAGPPRRFGFCPSSVKVVYVFVLYIYSFFFFNIMYIEMHTDK